MEITLEKIELVKDRTGATYKEAKEALEAADGSVVDAIIDLEEAFSVFEDREDFHGSKGRELIERAKETAEKGNMSRIVVKKDDEVLLNFPLTVSIVGAVIAPWGVIFGLIAAAGFNCKIEFINDKGEVTDINGKVKRQYDRARDRGSQTIDKIRDSELYNDIRYRGQDAFDDIRDKGQDAYDQLRDKGQDALDQFKDMSQEALEQLKQKGQDTWSDLKERSKRTGEEDAAEEPEVNLASEEPGQAAGEADEILSEETTAETEASDEAQDKAE